ncbi:MAG TPA: outer membrane protein assembly factor BamA [Bacteroidia bacterium]|nr:outer membrane protein assembly factor BamA [Bacteroidia bacterium]
MKKLVLLLLLVSSATFSFAQIEDGEKPVVPASETQVVPVTETQVVPVPLDTPDVLRPIIKPMIDNGNVGVMGGDSNLVDYGAPREYTLVKVNVIGTQFVNADIAVLISGLPVGDKIMIPGEKTSEALDNLWREGIFEDISLVINKIEGDYIWLDLIVVEKPMIFGKLLFNVKKSEAEDLEEKLPLQGLMFTSYRERHIIETVNEHYRDEGYLNCTSSVRTEFVDTTAKGRGFVKVYVTVEKGKKVKIKEINITGNQEFSTRKIRRKMKDTKRKRWYQVFKSSKYIKENLETDEENVLNMYHEKGYRDARIVHDTVRHVGTNRVEIDMHIEEGKKYYFRNITWVGNTKYSSEELSKRLGIQKGDVYNQGTLESRLFMSPLENDITSLYMDDGYLFFQINPVETAVEGDSIDFEMRIYEGRQATIRKVTVVGNTKTNDNVIMREIRTRPGQLFRRTDVIRSQRELASLGYFDPEKIQVNPIPDPYTGTVDIEYVVEERPSDQVELSGGWGGNRIVGTLGLSFNNFSARNLFNFSEYRPLPSGDGQKLSIRAQSNGLYFRSFNMSFTEPWLGGKKANSLSVTVYNSLQSNGLKRNAEGRADVNIWGVTVGYGMRLKKPDDYFYLFQDLTYQYYQLNNFFSVFAFSEGYANNLSYRITLSRNSTDQQIYPRSGVDLKVIGQFTPPYSLFNKIDYATADVQTRYKFVEYYKWKFTVSWYNRLVGNLVLSTRIGFGYLGMYNKEVGVAPFERFYLGGSGLTGFALDGREIIALRGYDDQSLSARTGAPIIAKYTWELRYPVSLNPSATVFGLAFVEAGNTWQDFRTFNPFDVYRSAGVGVRVFLPMFGLLGLDWGYRFDDVQGTSGMQKSQIHFSLGMNLGEL